MAARIVALLLAFLVTAGLGLSSVAAGGMAAKMAMAPGMASSETGDCGACGGNDADPMACPVSVCSAPLLAAAPPAVSTMIATALRLPLPQGTRPPGLTSLPDPNPPRSRDLI